MNIKFLFSKICFLIISAKTVKELEGMISEQRLLMEKLTDQCKNLTQKLEDTSHQHK